MSRVMEDMRDESIREGERRGKIATARRMLRTGRYPLEEIAEMTELSLDEVRDLQSKQGA